MKQQQYQLQNKLDILICHVTAEIRYIKCNKTNLN